jgi:hypothetical protein
VSVFASSYIPFRSFGEALAVVVVAAQASAATSPTRAMRLDGKR